MNSTEIKKSLFNPNINKYQLLARIKAESDYDTLKSKIKSIKSHPFGVIALESTPLPSSLSSLRKNNIVPHSGNLEAEIAWIMNSIMENSSKIDEFIKHKTLFERAILLGQYSNAEKELKTVNENICMSNWGVESEFVLTEESSGTESNWLLLKEVSTLTKDALCLFFAEQSSKKTEEKLSYYRFKSNFESVTDGVSSLLKEYLCFKVLYSGYTGYQSFSFFINVESVSSVIDRYLMLVDVLSEIVVLEKNELVEKILSELITAIPNDCRLTQINYLNSDNQEIPEINNELGNYLEAYTRGDYELCIQMSSQILIDFPTSIESYLIYVKSLIELRREFIEPGVSNNINYLSSNLFNLLSINSNYDKAVANLLKLALKYSSFSIGKQLFSVISQHINLKDLNKNHAVLRVVNSTYFNPITISDSIKYPITLRENVLKKNLVDSANLCIQLNAMIAFGEYKKIESCNKISNFRKPIYISKAIKNTLNNKALINYIENIRDFERLSTYSTRELVELLFCAYIEEKLYSEALSLYIKYYFVNQNIVSNLDSHLLLEKLKEIGYKSTSIDLPIFYSLVSPDIYERYVKYDDFTESLCVDRPMDLIHFQEIDRSKLIYFLKEICTIEILHHSLNFEGTDDIENERISILKHLLVIDQKSETEYIKEITEITQRSKIRKAIRVVNKGRITLNSQLLKNSVEVDIKESFLRFKELVDFSEEHKLQVIDPTNKLLNEYFQSLQEKSQRDKIININDPAYISFKSMMIDIRDKFILSKDFGLDGYLSTRIRHGALMNHIRSIFEASHLINQKNGDIYIDNLYWKAKVPREIIFKEIEIQNCLKDFSKRVDELTEYLVKELIQIKTEKHNLKEFALFDYSLNDQVLAFLFSQVKDSMNSHTAFLSYVIEFLEARTEALLNHIRNHFKNEITQKFTQLLEEFYSSIRDIIGPFPFVDLTSSIAKCQTNVQNEIINIIEWFRIANPLPDLILDIETIVKTAVEITNTIYPNENVDPSIDVACDMDVAAGSINMIYIIRILLDNIIKHSGLLSANRNISIKSDILNESVLRLFVSNDFDSNNYSKINDALAETKNKWNLDKTNFAKSNIEGGSGFDKIRRILAVDMSRTNYNFDYTINNNSVTIIIEFEIKILQTDE